MSLSTTARKDNAFPQKLMSYFRVEGGREGKKTTDVKRSVRQMAEWLQTETVNGVSSLVKKKKSFMEDRT